MVRTCPPLRGRRGARDAREFAELGDALVVESVVESAQKRRKVERSKLFGLVAAIISD